MTVRPEPVEARPELAEWGRRSWFDRALLSKVERLTTNGIIVVINFVTLDR